MRTSPATRPNLHRALKLFAANTGGATAIEYAMIAAGVGAAIAGTVYGLGSTIQDTLYNKINGVIK